MALGKEGEQTQVEVVAPRQGKQEGVKGDLENRLY